MTDILFFIKGFMIGMAMAAPVGPIGILCIHRSLSHGTMAGFLGGIGAAVADGLYGTVAAFGHAAVAGFLERHTVFLRLAGGLFLLAMAIRTYNRPLDAAVDGNDVAPHGVKQAIGDLISTFFLTLTNPATFIAFVVVFAAVGIDPEEVGSYAPSVMIVAGVFAGSLAWWGILSLGVGVFRKRITTESLRLINVVSGLVLGAFGGLVLGYTGYMLLQR